MIPKIYKDLNSWRDPKHLKIAFQYYGLKEIPGPAHNKTILQMAKFLGKKAGINVQDDETPWCGTFAGYCLLKAGWPIPNIAVRAKSFLNFGMEAPVPMRGDVMVFDRDGGGHVTFYVSEDEHTYHCIGGNQSNEVNIRAFAKNRLLGARRPKWKLLQPLGVHKVIIQNGKVINSITEA